jgi:uncharacterized protein (DUF1697 family)
MARRQPQTYVAFVRAVMHGRRGLHRSVLLDLFADAGATDARSYLTTGNVSFTLHPSAVARLVVEVEAALERVVGRRTEVFVRSVRELVELRNHDHFASVPLTVEHERLVTFLAQSVPPLTLPIWSPSRDLAVFAAGRRELCSAAVKHSDGTSRGPGGLIERITGTRVTSRAWSTVERILDAHT